MPQNLSFRQETLPGEGLLDPRKTLRIGAYDSSCQAVAEAMLSHTLGPVETLGKTLVLGTEECMYPALRLGEGLERLGAEVCCHATTRSPIGLCDAPGYPIRSGWKLPSFYEEERTTYVYNLREYDTVIVVSDTKKTDLRAIQALASVLTCKHLIYTQGEGVTLLLKDITGQIEPLGTQARERKIQSGTPYYEMLPIEYEPTPAYLHAYQDALARYAGITAEAVGSVARQIWAEKGDRAALVSLARAGTPVGILIKRYLKTYYHANVTHASVSIIRGRGIDENAMAWLLERHAPEDLQFVDGWTGKGAIQGQLQQAMQAYPGVSPGLAVLSDPACLAEKWGTREDFLIASSCLNSVVSGLLSRTVYRPDLIGPQDFHGAVFYDQWQDRDLTYQFIDRIEAHFRPPKQTPPPPGPQTDRTAAEEVTQICRVFGDEAHLGHLYQLAREKQVPLEVYPLVHYRACGLIREMADA